MINQKRIQLTKLALALSVALSAAPSFAQNTTSAIGGRISGPDGKPASGATVSVVHAESGSVSNVVTDAEGRYLARGLRTGGPYTIIVTKDGVSETREGVFTQLAETAAVDATLGAPIASVTVAGSAVRNERFSRTTMGSGTSINATEIATQASIARNLQDYARSDPRVSQTDKERGEISVAGQNTRYNSMTIDGVAVNDTFGLESNGSPTAKQPISIEAIQSVQVNVANYDVTQKGYTGGNINAVTKSGTNTIKGSVYYVFRNDKLAGDRFNTSDETYFAPAPFKETTKGITLGFPIIKDKLFVFANYEKLESTRAAPSFGPIGSPQTNVGITPSLIASAQAIARDTYNFDAGTNADPGLLLDVEESLVKVDWNVSDDHRVMFRYAKTAQSEPQFAGMSATGLSLSTQWYSQKKAIETLVGQWTADWTANFSTEVKFSQRDYDSVPILNSRLPIISLQTSGPTPVGTPSTVPSTNRFLSFGSDGPRHRNILGTKTADMYAGANWTLDDHELKFGVDHTNNEVYNAFINGLWGNYSFGCIPTNATLTYSFTTSLNCSNATQPQIEQAILENFRIGRPTSYSVVVPGAGLSIDDTAAQFSLKNTGVFVQDTWRVSPRLTLTYGLRLDATSISERPRLNAAVSQPLVPGNAATNVRETGGFGLDNTNTFDGQNLVQPRFGFNYQFDSAQRMQLRGGAGLFQGNAAAVWLSNPFSNPGVLTRTIGCGGSFPACPPGGGTFRADPDSQQTSFAGATPAANVDILAPGLRQPSVIKANLAFDTELPWYGLVFGAEYLHVDVKDGIFYQHLNLGAPTRFGSDGRALFYTPQGFNAACWTTAGNPINTGTVCSGNRSKALSNASFANVLVAQKTSKGGSNLVTLSLSRPSQAGLGWSMAYTYTDATEVSPLTSSQSNSNFTGRSVFNPNEEVTANSSYLVKNRVNALVNFQKRFFEGYKTSFGVFYEGRSGKPYSWTVNNDLNGDGSGGNDLMFIPSAIGSNEVTFYGDTATSRVNEEKFWSIVDSNDVLKKAAGGVVGRNTDFSPWTNSIDMRVSQELPGLFANNKAVFTLDFFNVGNMLNKRWGRINEVGFQGSGAQARSFVDYVGLDAQGKYIYKVRDAVESLDVRQLKGESQWAIQATVKYEF